VSREKGEGQREKMVEAAVAIMAKGASGTRLAPISTKGGKSKEV